MKHLVVQGTEWRVSADGPKEGGGFVCRTEFFHISRYEQAHELYILWLIRYPKAEVTIEEVPRYVWKQDKKVCSSK